MKPKTPFSKLSRQQKRVVILKDALAHLKAKRFVPKTGCIIEIIEGSSEVNKLHKYAGKELQTIIKEKTCNVCQRGAILFSMVWRSDNYIIDETAMGIQVESSAKPNAFVEKLFTKKQLSLMECAFEGDYGNRLSDVERESAFIFSDRNSNSGPEGLMEAILNNAIKNKGTFKP